MKGSWEYSQEGRRLLESLVFQGVVPISVFNIQEVRKRGPDPILSEIEEDVIEDSKIFLGRVLFSS